jgi:hypothetical protein
MVLDPVHPSRGPGLADVFRRDSAVAVAR